MSLRSLRAAFGLAAFCVLSISGCAHAQQLPPGVKAGAWTDLLGPNAAAHWRGYRVDSLPSAWAFDATTGVLTRTRPGGDIVTRQQYTDFEFEVDWRLGEKGNSGIFYHATEGTAVIYENAPEMQILDNKGHNDGRNTLTSAGANYGLDQPVRDVTKPLGEWNEARIVVIGSHVEHWLNDVKLLEYELWTPEWTAKVAKTKFAQWPTYGLARRGHIGLQEHGDVASFRHIRIRELSK